MNLINSRADVEETNNEETSPVSSPAPSNIIEDPLHETESEYICCNCGKKGKFQYSRNEEESFCPDCSHDKDDSCTEA